MSDLKRGHDSLFIQRVQSANLEGLVRLLADTCLEHQVPVATLARMFGVSRAAIYGWLTGEVTPRQRQRARIPRIVAQITGPGL